MAARTELAVLDLTSSMDRDEYTRLKGETRVLASQDFFGVGSDKETGCYPMIQRVVEYRPRDPVADVYTPPMC